jgi:hypothetical protein
VSPSRRLTAVRRCSGAYRIVMVSEAWPSNSRSSFTVTPRMTAPGREGVSERVEVHVVELGRRGIVLIMAAANRVGDSRVARILGLSVGSSLS